MDYKENGDDVLGKNEEIYQVLILDFVGPTVQQLKKKVVAKLFSEFQFLTVFF